MTENLWGDLPDATSTPCPESLLTEQANFLTEKTDGLLRGTVKREISMFSLDPEFPFLFRFLIVVPSLNNYEYEVCSIARPLTLYPARIESEHLEKPLVIENQNALNASLKSILQSTTLHKVIGALRAQA